MSQGISHSLEHGLPSPPEGWRHKPAGPLISGRLPQPQKRFQVGLCCSSPSVTLGEDTAQLTTALSCRHRVQSSGSHGTPLLLPMAWGEWGDLRNLLESCDLLPERVPGVRPMDLGGRVTSSDAREHLNSEARASCAGC